MRVNRRVGNTGRRACDFVDVDSIPVGEVFLLNFSNRRHQQAIIFFLNILLILGNVKYFYR